MKERSESEWMHMAAAYCAVAERCAWEVRKKLTGAGASSEMVSQIIVRLREKDFIHETRYCRSFVNDKFRFNRWGRLRIRYELQQKGLPADSIDDALSRIDETIYLQVLSDLLAEKKIIAKGVSERDIFLKLYRFACGRGFEHEQILRCLRPLFKAHYDVEDRI
jgi:regulatory protein